MCRIKRFFIITFSLIICENLSAQNNNKDFYLIFDSLSNKAYEYEIGNGKVAEEKVYRKELKKNGDRIFYIKKELFRNINKANTIDTCNIESWPENNISNLSELKRKLDTINALYPYKVYPNLFLIEKLNDSIFVRYKVKWEYYLG
ncbi:hypothetical protein [Christiangramia sabulilitoris]|uniref:Uncharacterized protein n=1 Tax=Christiangramia sabulilitoris TaxID=2583991 RepID=A0A550I741_9FLAO|nr:hypothetical protein [Christiangramia sabulilitoris]TRO66792.1 hypothetical protein FGM01_02560 [Christiangramia sabulilitoris]